MATIIVALASGLWSWWGRPARDRPPSVQRGSPDVPQTAGIAPATAVAAPTLAALGQLRPRGGVTTLAAPSGIGEARIAELRVSAGQSVAAGDVIGVLDSYRRLDANVAQAQSQARMRHAEVERAKLELAYAKAEAEAGLASARAAAETARQSLERTQALARNSTTTLAALEQAQSQAQARNADLHRAEAQVARFALPPERHPTILAAQEAAAAAEASVETAAVERDLAIIVSPISGTVLETLARSGERAGQNGVVRLGDTSAMIAELEVFESRIGRVRIGQSVSMRSQAFAGALSGTVSLIGREVLNQGVLSSDPAANTNARVVKVTVALDADSSRIAERLVNLQVLAAIAVEPTP
jgi:HlyD family secretion protein